MYFCNVPARTGQFPLFPSALPWDAFRGHELKLRQWSCSGSLSDFGTWLIVTDQLRRRGGQVVQNLSWFLARRPPPPPPPLGLLLMQLLSRLRLLLICCNVRVLQVSRHFNCCMIRKSFCYPWALVELKSRKRKWTHNVLDASRNVHQVPYLV